MIKLLGAGLLGCVGAFGSACLSHPAPLPHKHAIGDLVCMKENGHLAATEATETKYGSAGKRQFTSQ